MQTLFAMWNKVDPKHVSYLWFVCGAIDWSWKCFCSFHWVTGYSTCVLLCCTKDPVCLQWSVKWFSISLHFVAFCAVFCLCICDSGFTVLMPEEIGQVLFDVQCATECLPTVSSYTVNPLKKRDEQASKWVILILLQKHPLLHTF